VGERRERTFLEEPQQIVWFFRKGPKCVEGYSEQGKKTPNGDVEVKSTIMKKKGLKPGEKEVRMSLRQSIRRESGQELGGNR